MQQRCRWRYCDIFQRRKSGHPAIIDSDDEVFCSADSSFCSYYIGIWFAADVEQGTKDLNEWNTVKITITSTDTSVRTITFDDTSTKWETGVFSNNATEYEYYKAYIDNDVLDETNKLEIIAEACIGLIDLYASFTNYFLDAKHHMDETESSVREISKIGDLKTETESGDKYLYALEIWRDDSFQTKYRLRVTYPLTEYEHILQVM